MKTLKRNYLGFLTAVGLATFILAGSSPAFADNWGGHYRYQDRDGFWDNHHHYHGYEYYHHHRGYWDDNRGGVRVWINI